MDKCTHEVRMEYWKNIITQCQNRPEGQSAREWMNANDICEATYYAWQRKIRKQAYEQMTERRNNLPASQKTEEITFAELSIPSSINTKRMDLSETETFIHPVAIIKNDKFSIALSRDIPETVLVKILQEVSHA